MYIVLVSSEWDSNVKDYWISITLLIIRLAISVSKLHYIFFIFLKIITFKIFLPSLHILTLRCHRLCISLPFWCAVLLIIIGKRLTCFSCSSFLSWPVKLYGICCRSSLWVFSCAVDSHGIVGYSSQYWLLFFFLRFQLMLGIASPLLGQSLVVFDVVFFVVDLPSVSARLGFQDLVLVFSLLYSLS